MRASSDWFIVGMPYAGFVVAVGAVVVLTTPEYEHATYLHLGVIWLLWSVVAVVSVAVGINRFGRRWRQLRGRIRWMFVALSAPVVFAALLMLPFSISCLLTYNAGFVAYDAAFRACGGPPDLAWGGWGAHITLPTDSDYDRLKYSTKDPLLLGQPVYFCTASDAEAQGYPMIS
jgi:hypothetical protein